MRLDDWSAAVALYMPPAALGTLLGFAYAREMTSRQKIIYGLTAAPLAAYGAAATKEIFHFGDWTLGLLAILYAVAGMDAIGGLVMFGRKFRDDPIGTIRSVLALWRGTSS
jgi:hypothetical protein